MGDESISSPLTGGSRLIDNSADFMQAEAWILHRIKTSPLHSLRDPLYDTIKGPYTLQGYNETTGTQQFVNTKCTCKTYFDNLGPCDKHEEGSNGRCVYCDHELTCLPEIRREAAAEHSLSSISLELPSNSLELDSYLNGIREGVEDTCP